MIRRLSEADRKEAKEIWEICFGDSEAFIDAYFEQAAHIGDSFAYEEDGKILADLFMLKFHVKLAGIMHATDFLAGCATMPKARKRGLMKELVKHALRDMQKRGLSCVYLHPFLHAFYRKFGFETVAYIKRSSLRPQGNECSKIYTSMEGLPLNRMEEAYAACMDRFDNCFVRTHERFEAWLGLLFADNGRAVIYDDGKSLGYALYYNEKDSADVFELVSGTQKAETILNGIDALRADYFMPAVREASESEEFTMMRVLDPKRLIVCARPVESEIILHIADEFMERDYNLLIRADGGGNSVSVTDGKADMELLPEGLAAALAGTDKTELFGKQTACFFETY